MSCKPFYLGNRLFMIFLPQCSFMQFVMLFNFSNLFLIQLDGQWSKYIKILSIITYIYDKS
jgi:hypothetical protein